MTDKKSSRLTSVDRKRMNRVLSEDGLTNLNVIKLFESVDRGAGTPEEVAKSTGISIVEVNRALQVALDAQLVIRLNGRLKLGRTGLWVKRNG